MGVARGGRGGECLTVLFLLRAADQVVAGRLDRVVSEAPTGEPTGAVVAGVDAIECGSGRGGADGEVVEVVLGCGAGLLTRGEPLSCWALAFGAAAAFIVPSLLSLVP